MKAVDGDVNGQKGVFIDDGPTYEMTKLREMCDSLNDLRRYMARNRREVNLWNNYFSIRNAVNIYIPSSIPRNRCQSIA